MQPGGGVPGTRVDSSRHASHHVAHYMPARSAETVDPTPAEVAPQLPAEAPPDEAAPVATRVDAVAAPSHLAQPPDAKVDAASRAAWAAGTGPGANGGPGGRGTGAGGAKVPVVSRAFAFGRDTRAAFKGVVCFIRPGVLRIADVHGCAPVAFFYTNTFDVGERQQEEGFPGISDRSTWFMIEYTGAFTVGKDGTYDFRLHSDDGSYLFIDGTVVIENDGKHKPESRSGKRRAPRRFASAPDPLRADHRPDGAPALRSPAGCQLRGAVLAAPLTCPGRGTMKLRRTIIFVKDIQRMTAFYRDGLGLRLQSETSSEDWVEFEAGGALALHAIPARIAKGIEIADPPRARGETPIKLVFQTADVDAVRDHLKAHGAVMSEPRSWGACDGVDPEGNVFQIVKT